MPTPGGIGASAMPLRWPRALLGRVSAHVPRQLRRIGAKLAEWDRAEGEEGTAAKRGRLHYWLPFAIVAVSVGAAAMGWQASVADERATHHDVVSRQDLVRLSQIKLQKLQGVDAELRTYGDYERSALLAGEQARDAAAVTGAESRRLWADASVNAGLALSLFEQLRLAGHRPGSPRPYDVQAALVQAETGDADLSSVEPNALRVEARDQRNRSLHMTGLAVLYVAALVFFTLAAVTGGRRARSFAVLGAIVALTAVAAFPFVRWS
jgi:hypothetical protein